MHYLRISYDLTYVCDLKNKANKQSSNRITTQRANWWLLEGRGVRELVERGEGTNKAKIGSYKIVTRK